MADQKNPKEASQLFHNIIKASVSPKATGAVATHGSSETIRCEKCGEIAKARGQQVRGKFLVIRYDCPNGHTFERKVPLA